MEVLYTKIIALSLLGGLTLALGLAPVLLVKYLHNKKTHGRSHRPDALVSYMLCFGGGVLLGTCLLHMFPEVKENFDSASAGDPRFVINYPIPELMICVGFFLVYFVEEIVHVCAGAHGPHFGHSHETCTKFNGVTSEGGSDSTALLSSDSPGDTGDIPRHEYHVHYQDDAICEAKCSSVMTGKLPHNYGSVDFTTSNTGHVHVHASGAHAHTSSSTDSVERTGQRGSFRGLLVVAALSFHSIFEGMAVGLQESNNGVWTLFGAIAIHKLVLAFCVGLELRCMGTRLLIIAVYMGIFAAMCPVGVGIGTVVMETSAGITATHTFVIGCLQAIAAGTLMYVTFFEVLQDERSVTRSGMLRLLCTVAGFALLAGMKVLDTHAENPLQDGAV